MAPPLAVPALCFRRLPHHGGLGGGRGVGEGFGEGVGCCQDSGGGLFDEFGFPFAPAGDVADAVVAGVQAQDAGDDVGDAFGFGFFDAAVFDVFGVVFGAMQDDVRGFMQRGFCCVCGAQSAADSDASLSVGGGVTVGGAGDFVAGHGPSLAGEVVGDSGGDAGGVIPYQAVGNGAVVFGGGVGEVGLGDVKDADREESDCVAFGFFAGGLVFFGPSDVAACEDT